MPLIAVERMHVNNRSTRLKNWSRVLTTLHVEQALDVASLAPLALLLHVSGCSAPRCAPSSPPPSDSAALSGTAEGLSLAVLAVNLVPGKIAVEVGGKRTPSTEED